MAKKTFKNVAKGARGVRGADGELVMIEPGESATVDVNDGELADLKANDDFEIGGAKAKAKSADDDGGEGSEGGGNAGPLDGSVEDLKAHVEGLEDVDALKELGKQEAEGKNRSTALAAIQARIDELEKPAE